MVGGGGSWFRGPCREEQLQGLLEKRRAGAVGHTSTWGASQTDTGGSFELEQLLLQGLVFFFVCSGWVLEPLRRLCAGREACGTPKAWVVQLLTLRV